MSYGKKDRKPYRIVCAYDTETNNMPSLLSGVSAFPICHQLGIVSPDTDLTSITPQNVENVCKVDILRHTEDAYSRFDELIQLGIRGNFVPVVMVHNLGFDMYSLSYYLNRYEVKVLAKSCTKPITFTVLDGNGDAMLVFWDTLVFWGKPLAVLGDECEYPKLKGFWDYDLQRTPDTPLTYKEIMYATHDIYVIFAYLGYYLRKNEYIDVDDLALSVVTKTGAVRYKRKKLLDRVKGDGSKHDVGRYWIYQNNKELPKTNDELFTMHACMRGGFTFCAREFAGVPFDLVGTDYVIAGFDASSQHPAQMVSHIYPEQFAPATPESLDLDRETIECYDVLHVIDNWAFPFPIAFNAYFEFENLRYKKGSIYEKYGISPLAYSRISDRPLEMNEENQQGGEFSEMIGKLGYKDFAENETHCFGKLESAGRCGLWLTELAYWEVCQVFEWDSCKAVCGYDTMKFARPSDMTVLSVMEFYKAKDVFKAAKNAYEANEPMPDMQALEAASSKDMARKMQDGTASYSDVKAQYLSIKADLNALFGIEATNEAKQDMVLTASGLETLPANGIDDLPKHPKAWYQMGQRIVGWSRIAQICAMELAKQHIDGIVNGDTDSVKFLVDSSKLEELQSSIDKLGDGIDNARSYVTARVKKQYRDRYYDLEGIGHYELEFASKRFMASWNKAYCMQEMDNRSEKMRFNFTIAGIPADARTIDCKGNIYDNSYNDLADLLYSKGWNFGEISSLLLGYNVTVDSSITKLNSRHIPEWGSMYTGDVTDCYGKTYRVEEPCALGLAAMPKTIGATDEMDNAVNLKHAMANNQLINSKPVLIAWEPDREPTIERLQ